AEPAASAGAADCGAASAWRGDRSHRAISAAHETVLESAGLGLGPLRSDRRGPGRVGLAAPSPAAYVLLMQGLRKKILIAGLAAILAAACGDDGLARTKKRHIRHHNTPHVSRDSGIPVDYDGTPIIMQGFHRTR